MYIQNGFNAGIDQKSGMKGPAGVHSVPDLF